MLDEIKLLRIIESDARLTGAEIAAMLGENAQEVERAIKRLETANIILGYRTQVNWDISDREVVTAMIEVNAAPSRGQGFDRVASRIYQFPEVKSVYLMSGGYDLLLMITGRTMRQVAFFVAEKLSTLECVTGTATHFVLKKYKENGIVFDEGERTDERIMMT